MNNKELYEKLVREGYVESGSLVIKVDDITKIQLTTEQLQSVISKNGGRQDKGVFIIDKQGRLKKVSSLLMGYNKENIKLSDGEFANTEDLLSAIETAINELDSGTLIVDKKGNFLNPEELLHVVSETAGKIKIGEKSSKVTNQDSKYWSVEDVKKNVEYKKGIVFLGNNGIDLKSGDYVSIDELITCLNDFVIMKPLQKDDFNKKTLGRVSKKVKNKLSRWLLILSALGILFSVVREKDNLKKIDIPEDVTENIEQMIEQEQLSYLINGTVIELTEESIEEMHRKIVSELKMGDVVELQDGDTLYESSNLSGKKVVIGEGLRQAGDYQISGVSILCNGVIRDFSVDTSINNPGFDIGSFVSEVCQKHNLDLSETEIRLHIGNDTDYTRTGWIDVANLIKEDAVREKLVSESSLLASTYEGQIDNFKGKTIVIDTVNGPVEINLFNSNDELLKPGTTVIGSDGKEYRIEKIDLSTVSAEESKDIKTDIFEKENIAEKELTWSIQDCSLAASLTPLLLAIAAEAATIKKNKEYQKRPSLIAFENEEAYLKFIENEEECKKDSKYQELLKRVFYRKEVDVLQMLTNEQTEQICSIIRNWHDSNYSYNLGDSINFKEGRIIITHSDGSAQDITDIIIPAVASIGIDNKVTLEGSFGLEEEVKSGIRK